MKQTFKKLSAFMMALVISGSLFAQVPQKFNYQGIARDTKGNPMAQQRMTLKLTVLPAADATTGEYEEIQTVTTNEFGLYTLQIGNGTPLNGEMKAVKWETGNKYIKVAIDPKGGNDFVDAGTNQLLSVPYAIYADKAGTAKNAGGGDRLGAVSTSASGTGTVNYLTKFTAPNTIFNSQLFDNGTNIGIGTTSPAARLHLFSNVAGVQQQIRMQNASTTGASRFRMDNDGTLSYATFSKYGTAYASGYPGIPALYPYANLLAFGNNGLAADDGLGRFLISNGGNIGLSIFKGGTSKLKFHADYATENVGIGGNIAPVSRVHLNNTDGTTMDLRLTNNTTGHTASDGLEIRTVGNAAAVMNNENADLNLGTNGTNRIKIQADGKVGVGSTSPNAGLHVISSVSDTAIYASSSNSSYSQIGVLGTYNTSMYGVGIAGIGWAGGIAPDSMDVGVYGSSGNIGVWSNGKLRVTDGTQGVGKIMQSNADGDASWVTPSYLSGSGTTNRISMFTPSGTQVGNSLLSQGGTGLNKFVQNNGGSYAWSDTVNGNLFNISLDSNGRLLFIPNTTSSTATPYMILDDVGGRLTIGNVSSTPSGYKLYVEDGILTERLKVAVSGTANWADYVFAPDYKLMPLEDVEAFVKENKHLPNVPSADKMVETGIDVATVDAKLMEKIEELTLYMIDMKKEINTLKKENEAFKANLKK
jgi:hypothetical protein